MRVRPGPSKPGNPPHAHTRSGLREINFDVQGQSAIVGPRKFRGSNFFNKTVPEIHEKGGLAVSLRRFGLYRYPERSFMYSAAKRLVRRGLIAARFSITLRRNF